ncbi:MAG: NuoM family protein [Thermoplasmata archaeon]
MQFPILSLLIIIPFIGSVLTIASGKRYAKWVSLGFAIVGLILSAILVLHFLPDSPIVFDERGYGTQGGSFFAYEEYPWAPSFGLSYTVGVDGLSAPLVFLTQLLVLMGLIFSWKKEERPHQFFGLILLIGLSITGVFVSLDLFVFFIFWELVLIPMYFFIAVWGGPNRHYASIKFLVYTHVGSVVMLLGIFALYLNSGILTADGSRTFSLITFLEAAQADPLFLQMALQVPLFIAFLFGFGVKMPMVPFHTWLPDAHVEAPTAGSVILAGLLLKMGGYGIFRISLGVLPEATRELWWLLAIFGIVSIVYAAFVCLAQTDLKRLVAYSSISHMGFVLLGAATMTTAGMAGGVFQMFNHGLITAVLFMLAGSVKHATGTREIPSLGGLSRVMPKFSLLLMIGFFASMGLPGLNGFVSEFLVFLGSYELFSTIELGKLIIIPLLGVIVTAAYYLWTLHKVVLGDLKESLKNVLDIPNHEVIPLAILVFMIILLGLYPTPVVGVIWPHAQGLNGLLGGP